MKGTRAPVQDGEAFHFISYLPVNGALYELDGLQQGPIRLASNVNTEARRAAGRAGRGIARCSGRAWVSNQRAHVASAVVCAPAQAEWLQAVIPHISARMERYAAGEVRFNLMALIADRRAVLQQQVGGSSWGWRRGGGAVRLRAPLACLLDARTPTIACALPHAAASRCAQTDCVCQG